ncbi:MAG: recombinase family protein [Hyphomonadaceae bacterium]|nr:recombinase family protein [Clostridia bacterium]
MPNKLKVAAYCRVSTDKNDQAHSLASQKSYFTNYITNHDHWQLVRVYADEGITGTSTKKRVAFNQMITDAQQGEINLIITKEISRFARNTLDSIYYTRTLKKAGIGVIFINDNLDTLGDDSEFRLTLMASMAQEESRKTSERVKWGQKRRMEQGVVFGRDLLGYTVKDGKLILSPQEAPIVKLIFHKFLTEGKGTHIIARELYEAGIFAKRVRHWSNTAILRVLRNEKYVGDLLQKKTITKDFLDHKKQYNRGEEEMVYIKEHHEAIIDRAMWDRTQAELARRSPSDQQKSKHSNRYWCSGKLICGECGGHFIHKSKKLKDGTAHSTWRCANNAKHGTLGCSNGSINDKVLASCMHYIIKHLHHNQEHLIQALMHDIASVQNVPINTTHLQRSIEALHEKKKKAIDLLIEGLITNDEFSLMKQQYDDEISAFEQKVAQSENANNLQIKGVTQYINQIKQILLYDENSQIIYKELVREIVIYNGTILSIRLNGLPSTLQISYATSGRRSSFHVQIIDMCFEDALL